MARVTIIAEDSMIGVGGEFRPIDLSGLPANIHAIQWDESAGHGWIEFNDGAPNEVIEDFRRFEEFRRRWNEWRPPEPPVQTPEERRSTLKNVAVEEATRRMADSVLKEIDAGRLQDEDSVRNSDKYRMP